MDEVAGTETATVGGEPPTGDAFAPAGTQTVVRTPANADPLAALPRRAYDNLLVVSTRYHPSKLEARIERRGHDPANVGVVPVVPAADEYRGDLWTTDPVEPDDLTGIGMYFSDALQYVESGTGWVLLDALGVLLTYSEDARVCRFFQTLANRVRVREAHGVYCVNPEAIADETYERFRSMCDAEYEMG